MGEGVGESEDMGGGKGVGEGVGKGVANRRWGGAAAVDEAAGRAVGLPPWLRLPNEE